MLMLAAAGGPPRSGTEVTLLVFEVVGGSFGVGQVSSDDAAQVTLNRFETNLPQDHGTPVSAGGSSPTVWAERDTAHLVDLVAPRGQAGP